MNPLVAAVEWEAQSARVLGYMNDRASDPCGPDPASWVLPDPSAPPRAPKAFPVLRCRKRGVR